MASTHRILAGLDLTAMDDHLIAFLSKYSSALNADKIYFLHMTQELDLPEELKKKPYLAAPVDEAIAKEIESKIHQQFNPEEPPEIEIEVRKGGAQKGVLYWSRTKDVDLIAVGVKKGDGTAGLLPDKIVKVSSCSVLLVPQKKAANIRKICVAIDFSEVSLLALKEALKFAAKLDAEVSCVHVYSVPAGYHYRGKDYDEFIEVVKKNAIKETGEFLEKAGRNDLKVDYILDEKNNVAAKITEYVQNTSVDLIIAGSKGRTAVSSLLVGSAAEKLTKSINNIPLFIIKRKNENMDLLDALIKV